MNARSQRSKGKEPLKKTGATLVEASSKPTSTPIAPPKVEEIVSGVAATVVTQTVKVSRAFYERTFLTYQRQLREGGTHVLNEAMLVLDIIDAKANSLLAYISISLAALVFLLTSLSSSNLNFLFLGQSVLTISILLTLLALLVAILLCLSCLNIVGSHTIQKLSIDNRLSPEEYEELIVKVTLSRRLRYRLAHRISMSTATITLLIFAFLLAGALAPKPKDSVVVSGGQKSTSPLVNYSPGPGTTTKPIAGKPSKALMGDKVQRR